MLNSFSSGNSFAENLNTQESLFFAAEALTIFQWGSLSDRIGRKPVILIGLGGIVISTLLFGLSTTFWALVASRCLCGALNGNSGVMKSSLGEITDETNRAQGFSFIPVMWAIGATIGPFLGGVLSRPQEQFPTIFTSQFWADFPYFLPCVLSAAFALVAFLLIAFFFQETLCRKDRVNPDGYLPGNVQDGQAVKRPKTVPIRALLTRPVLLAISNYAMLALVDMALMCMAPLYYSTPIPLGGLGLSPSAIGVYLGLFSILNGFSQLLLFPRIVRRIGTKTTLYIAMGAFIPIFIWFPVTSQIARLNGLSLPVWLAMALQLVMMAMMDMAYPIVFIYITASAPNKYSYGAVNGLAQTVTSIMRTIGPAAATSLFAFSMESNLVGGNFVYIVLIITSLFSLLLVAKLPSKPWSPDEV